jgi:hypothetical protein
MRIKTCPLAEVSPIWLAGVVVLCDIGLAVIIGGIYKLL